MALKVSTDKSLLDLPLIFQYLNEQAYWSKGRTLEMVERSIENSLCFGLYDDGQQLGFARVVTDYTIFAWLMDVFILPDFQGAGHGKTLLDGVFNYPALAQIKTWGLKTRDAHTLYRQFGFQALEKPEMHMEWIKKDQA